jgi:FMN phosphatase YigB (HAD superfamily)
VIRAILLDNFGVLYIPKQQYAYQALLMNPNVHRDEIESLRHQSEYGLIGDDELFEAISRLTDTPLTEVKRHLVNGFVRNGDLLAYVQNLRKTYKVALVSNIGVDSIQHYFSGDEQRQLFDAVVLSSSVGMIKPHPEIFEYTCEKLGVDVSETVMVDDLAENCEGAREAGLQAIVYESLPQLQADLAELGVGNA